MTCPLCGSHFTPRSWEDPLRCVVRLGWHLIHAHGVDPLGVRQ